jgi:GT2 family glycosyltransferase
MLWVCIPVYNRIHFTLKCLESLSQQDYSHYTVVVCDDGSTDGTAQAIAAQYPKVVMLHGNGNLWWSGATNRCIEYVMQHSTNPSDCIVTLNNDLEVPENYLSSLANAALKYPGALVSSVGYDIKTRRMVSPGYRQSWLTTKSRPINPLTDHLPGDNNIASVTHAAGRGTLIPLDVLRKVGLFDERHLPQYGADYDLSFRAARIGHPVLVNFLAQVFSHIEETGITKIRDKFSLKGFQQYLTSIKSPANLSARWWVAVNNCPKWLLPSYMMLDMMFIVGSYFKYHWRCYTGRKD